MVKRRTDIKGPRPKPTAVERRVDRGVWKMNDICGGTSWAHRVDLRVLDLAEFATQGIIAQAKCKVAAYKMFNEAVYPYYGFAPYGEHLYYENDAMELYLEWIEQIRAVRAGTWKSRRAWL